MRTVSNFDQLPVPFRAVATDIGTGEMVVLDHGDLGRALRASMAIPTMFTAVEMDGRLLVDGGISNNVPVDVVRAMGADVVIAIDIGSPLLAPDKVGRSFLTILNQTTGLMTRANMAPRLASADVVITPDVAGFGMLQFDRGKEIIAKGEEEARKLVERLKPYALSEEEYRQWKAARHRVPDPIPMVTSVRIVGNQRVDARVLAPLVRMKAGTPFSPEKARDDLSRIFGLGDFETVDVALIADGDGAAVEYRLREKPWGPTYLRAGLGFESNGQGDNNLSLLAMVNKTRINAMGAEWKTEIQFGSTSIASTGFYQPLGFRGGWFVEPLFLYKRFDVPYYVDGEPVANFEVRQEEARIDLGHQFGRYGELRLGADWSFATPRRESGVIPPELDLVEGDTLNRAGAVLVGTVDRLDSGTVPRHGGLLRLTAFRGLESMGSDDTYTRIELNSNEFWTRGRHTLFGGLNGGVSPGGDLPLYDQFTLGGLFSLSGYASRELRGDNYGLLRLGYYYRFGKNVYVGGFLEGANVALLPEDLLEEPVYTATAMLAYDSAFGPFYLGFGSAGSGHTQFYARLGRQF